LPQRRVLLRMLLRVLRRTLQRPEATAGGERWGLNANLQCQRKQISSSGRSPERPFH